MTEIGPGDLVECIHTVTPPNGASPITAGLIYRVRDLWDTRRPGLYVQTCVACGGSVSVGLEEVPDPSPFEWCLCVFRPVRRGSKGMFDHLLEPVKEGELV